MARPASNIQIDKSQGLSASAGDSAAAGVVHSPLIATKSERSPDNTYGSSVGIAWEGGGPPPSAVTAERLPPPRLVVPRLRLPSVVAGNAAYQESALRELESERRSSLASEGPRDAAADPAHDSPESTARYRPLDGSNDGEGRGVQVTQELTTVAASQTTDPSSSAVRGDRLLISPRKVLPRAIFVDWARSIAVFVVVVVHVFVSVPRVTVVSNDMQAKIDGSFRVVLQYGMPFFFYFSGRSAAFARSDPYMISFIVGKLKRLVLPLIVGTVVVVIPTNYVGRSYRPCGNPAIDNFFSYYGYYFSKGLACNGFDWYWFLPVLFLISILNQYFLQWVKDRYPIAYEKGPSFRWRMDVKPIVYICMFFAFMLAVGGGVLGGPMLLLSMTAFPHAFIFILVIFIRPILDHNLVYLLYLAAPLPSLVCAGLAYDPQSHHASAVPSFFQNYSDPFLMVLFYNFFYFEGYIDQIFDDDWKRWRDSAAVHSALKPFALLGLIVGLAITAPSTSDAGYLFAYPLYKASWWNCVCYVGGTWLWLMLWVRYSETFYNDVLNSFEYTHLTQSSLVIYLTHWLWIDSVQVLLVKPYGMSFVAGACIVIPITTVMCIVTYALTVQLERAVETLKGKLCGGRQRRTATSSSPR